MLLYFNSKGCPSHVQDGLFKGCKSFAYVAVASSNLVLEPPHSNCHNLNRARHRSMLGGWLTGCCSEHLELASAVYIASGLGRAGSLKPCCCACTTAEVMIFCCGPTQESTGSAGCCGLTSPGCTGCGAACEATGRLAGDSCEAACRAGQRASAAG